MIRKHFLRNCVFPCLILCSSTAHATSITWIAQNPNNDLNDSNNWNLNTVPGSSDNAVFDSAIFHIETNPINNSLPFSVSTFNFPHNASVFNFVFNNTTLALNGIGLTGTNTNPTIAIINTNNSSFPGDLVSFLGGIGTSGSSSITSSNSGTLTGSQSGMAIGAINSNVYSNGAFIIANGGNITASNTGNDSTNGTGNNGSANTGASQLRFDQSFTASDNVAVSVSNSGTFSGANTVQGDAVAIINGAQFMSSGAFQVGDNFSCEVQNTGNDSSLGVGLSNIGQVNAAQMILQTTATVGNDCAIAVSNHGMNSSQTTNFPDFIGYLNDQQFFVGNTFQAGDNLSLTVSNTGTDTSNGYGGYQTAVINSNSGTTGNQILFQQGCTLGDQAAIHAANSGTCSGTNTNGGSNTAGMNLQQIVIGDGTAPGTFDFVAGDRFNLSASNSGVDSSNGTGGNATGTVSTDQITLFTPAVLGTHANIAITNGGNFSGNASTTYVNVGSAGSSQLNCVSSVFVDDDFTLSVSNSGTNTGSGIGGYFIGDLGGQQVTFQESLIVGNNAFIAISNSGSNSSNTINNNQVGSLTGYGKQLLAKNLFQIGDDFLLEITNSGFDDSTGPGGNFVGFVSNNTVDDSASQFHLADGGIVGDRASITLLNIGAYQGSNTTSANSIAVLAGQQLFSMNDFQAGNNFSLIVSNGGIDHASGQDNNSIGTVGSSQVEFDGVFSVTDGLQMTISNQGANNGDGNLNYVGNVVNSQLYTTNSSTIFNAGSNAIINVINTGINSGTGTPFNFIGSVAAQVQFNGVFNASDGLQMTITNEGTNDGASTNNFVGYVANSQLYTTDSSTSFNAGSNATINVTNTRIGTGNLVGYVGGQIFFAGDFSALENLVLTATNNGTGTVANNQIIFNGGFSPGRCATLSAINNNSDTLTSGIQFSGASTVTGGDVLINLINSSLNIATGPGTAPFTISGLNGNTASSVISNQDLIIGLADSCVTSAIFGGSIGGLTGMTLTKNGVGTQTLSGMNTYTGLTSIQEGTLSINGSVVGDVTVSSGGILKGSGSIGGATVIGNGATLSPGDPIGTITLGSLALNSNSRTVIEIDPAGFSSIQVTDSSAVDGPLHIVQDPGAYTHQGSYLILSSGSLSGGFSSISSTPGFTFNLSRIGNDIYLNYLLRIPTQGLSENSLIVAKHLNVNAPPSSAFTFLAGLTGNALNRALESVSPSRNAFGTYIAAQTAFSLSGIVSTRMDELRFSREEFLQDHFLSALTADCSSRIAKPVRCKEPKNEFSAWVSVFGEFSHQSASQQNPSFNFISGAALIGIDYQGRNRGVAGGSLGYAHTYYSEDHHFGHGNINYYFASVYGNWFTGDFYFSPAVWGLFNQIKNTRNISFPGFSEKAHADIFAWQFIPHLEVGYNGRFCWGDIIPFTSADWAMSWQRGYTEHGASPFNAKQHAKRSSMVRSETGLKFCEKWEYTWGAFFLREKVSYVFEKPFETGTVNATFVGTPGSFTVTAVNQNLNLGVIGLDFLFVIEKQRPVKIDLAYEGEFGSQYWSNQLKLTVSKDF